MPFDGRWRHIKRMLKNFMAATAAACALSGCVQSTGIMPAGPNTYILKERFAPIQGGSTGAQQSALTKANAYCAGLGLAFVPVDMHTPISFNPYGPTDYSVTFGCFPPDSPQVRGFRMERAPNFILEQRSR